MIIGLDLDQTLFCLNKPLIREIKDRLGITIKDTDFKAWDFSCFPKIVSQEFYKIFKEPEIMGNLLPYQGVQEKLNQWKKEGHTLVAITKRSRSVIRATHDMVRRHFPMIDVTIVTDTDKKRYWKEYNIDIWIDDAPHGIEDALEMEIPVVMISNSGTGYNHHLRNNVLIERGVVDINLEEVKIISVLKKLKQR